MNLEPGRRYDFSPDRQRMLFALVGWAIAVVIGVLWDSIDAGQFVFSIGTVVRLIGVSIGLYLGWPLMRKRTKANVFRRS